MEASRPATKNVFAVIVATMAALFARSWLQVKLLRDGLQKDYAADLSHLATFPILLVLMFPIWRLDKAHLVKQFRPSMLSASIILRAVAVGILLRVLWWSMTIAGVSFGIFRNNDPFAIEGPLFSFQCPAAQVALVGFLVMAVLVPIVEEVTHRAYVQSSLRRRGPVVAIAVSATVFAILHPPSNWSFTFVAGVVFGIQYWNSPSLWPSLISHATYNSLIQIDWRCLHGVWNPPISELPLWRIGIPATGILVFATISIACLIRSTKTRRDDKPPRR
jgi:membrane protease YdiL (CAAX protease family)